MLKVEILDDDLRELILKGKNKGKYKKYARVWQQKMKIQQLG